MSTNNNQSNLKKVLKNIIHLEDFESQESLYQFVKKNIKKTNFFYAFCLI